MRHTLIQPLQKMSIHTSLKLDSLWSSVLTKQFNNTILLNCTLWQFSTIHQALYIGITVNTEAVVLSMNIQNKNTDTVNELITKWQAHFPL
jgi:hypothetical protein